MINFIKFNKKLLMEYSPMNGTGWINELFENDESILVKNQFSLVEDDIYEHKDLPDTFDEMYFCVARIDNGYYKFDNEILNLKHNLYIDSDIEISIDMFIAPRNVCIFKKIYELIDNDLYIGFEEDDLPANEFFNMLATFPNTYEINKYVNSRIYNTLKEYFDIKTDYTKSYNNYLNKKFDKNHIKPRNMLNDFKDYELTKYKEILYRLEDMLDSEVGFSEKVWQNEILGVLQILYPKYIDVFEEVTINDVYNKKKKRLDYLLVSANGSIDIVEIKKPSDSSIVSNSKYRNNYVPKRELSGTIMQIEKYIYMLNAWGKTGEDSLTQKYYKNSKMDIKIKITNPNGIIIMGRDLDLNSEQMNDLEIIKRKYKNLIDIMTYDDLIRRLELLINKFENS